MTKNGPKCAELGWECIPLAVETYMYMDGGWGEKAQETFDHISKRLSGEAGHVWETKPDFGEEEG